MCALLLVELCQATLQFRYLINPSPRVLVHSFAVTRPYYCPLSRTFRDNGCLADRIGKYVIRAFQTQTARHLLAVECPSYAHWGTPTGAMRVRPGWSHHISRISDLEFAEYIK